MPDFYSQQSKVQQDDYKQFLKIVGSLSNLSSESNVPYLYYRMAEKIFCRSFDAEDLSRSDVSADAKKSSLGIGLKTFLGQNNKTFQKVAEFNSGSQSFRNLDAENLVREISKLRNERIGFTESVHNIEKSIYHCIFREKEVFKVFEKRMNKIDLDKIVIDVDKKITILFNDGIEEYSFSKSKSTLSKRFDTPDFIDVFKVEVLDDPLHVLQSCLYEKSSPLHLSKENDEENIVYLPLYGSKNTVRDKSGLNQWNASGRVRNYDEVYIPIPATIHRKFTDFFPARDVKFELKFPDGEVVSAKVCQDGRKALMTNPNKKLGKLTLRDGLKLAECETCHL